MKYFVMMKYDFQKQPYSVLVCVTRETDIQLARDKGWLLINDEPVPFEEAAQAIANQGNVVNEDLERKMRDFVGEDVWNDIQINMRIGDKVKEFINEELFDDQD